MGFFGRLGHVYEVRKKKEDKRGGNTLHDSEGNSEVLHWSVHVCNSEPDEVKWERR